ncbi:DUF7117 family protein [Halocatena halophila]|uniref:DUF7117 family protein n=1 Tax=Halocatena halophila TaxID=2814576 RepID=UPI002ED3F3B7
MKIRGHRECRDCGIEWSYYESGSIACPSCGSVRSRGLDDRTEHTAGRASLDLTPARQAIEEEDLKAGLSIAATTCRSYRATAGFINAGSLEPLSTTYLGATELQYATREAKLRTTLDDSERRYCYALLNGADSGERPDPDNVPASMHQPRGLADAASVDAYRSAIRTALGDTVDPAIGRLLTRIDDHRSRIEALDGAVDPAVGATLIVAVQSVGEHIREESDGLETARERLDELV